MIIERGRAHLPGYALKHFGATMGRFRKDNGKAIRSGCRQFVVLCQRLDLFSDELIAIDGNKFKAANNRCCNLTNAKLERRMRDIEASIARYLDAMVSTVLGN